jgi:hypothetical protein
MFRNNDNKGRRYIKSYKNNKGISVRKEMRTTIRFYKLPSFLTGKTSAPTLSLMVLLIGTILFAAPSAAMAQQQQQATTAPTTEPLTPEEQREQDRLQRTINAITQNLAQGQKEINGIVYTPRWSEPVWVQPNSLSMLFVYCLPGEFADSGQEILGGSELEVLESYSLAVTADLTGWLMVVQNEDEIVRLPAAVGVICASDADDPDARTLSSQEQTEINNIIQQFITVRNTVINNVTQVINIINNVTTNGTGGPTNDTGGPTNDTGGPTNDTGGPIIPPPPTNDTGGNVTEEITPPPTEGITPPLSNETEGITPPPTEGITPPPTEGGAEPPPTEGGAEPSPTEGGAEPSPTEGGAEPSPTEGGAESIIPGT